MEERGKLSRREFLKIFGLGSFLAGCTYAWPKTLKPIEPSQVSTSVTDEPIETWMDIKLPSPDLFINLKEDTKSTVYYLDSTKYGNLPPDSKQNLILDWLSRYFSDADDGSPKLLDDLIRNVSSFFWATMSSKDAKKLYEKGIRILAANVAGENFFLLATPKEGVFGYDQIMAIEVPVRELLEENFSFASPDSDEAIMAELLMNLVHNIEIGHANKDVAFAVPPEYREEIVEMLEDDFKPRKAVNQLITSHQNIIEEDNGALLYDPKLITAEKIITGGEEDLDEYLVEERLVAGTEVKIRKFACRKDSDGQLRFYALVSLNESRNVADNSALQQKTIDNYFDGYRWVPVDSLVVYRYPSIFGLDQLFRLFSRSIEEGFKEAKV